MAGLAGKFSLMNLRGKGTVGQGESEVDIAQLGTQPQYCDENGNPFGHVYYDGCSMVDWQSRFNRVNPNGADNENPPRRW
jgi:hypothetical protein